MPESESDALRDPQRGANSRTDAADRAPPKTATVSGRWLVIVVSTVGLILIAALVMSFRACGEGRFVNGSVAVEGRINVADLARGIVGCMVQNRATELPPSSRPVPEDVKATFGDGYTSTPADWDQPVFHCAGFAMKGPQRYRYTWTRTSPDEGVARADSDRDGDGTPDIIFEMPVRCQGEGASRGCGAAKIEEHGAAPH